MAAVVSDTALYAVQQNSPVQLAIEIGDEQVGGTSILWQGQIREIPGNGGDRFGSKGEDLRHQILHCVTTVRDINKQTNRTSVTYTLSGGQATQRFPYTVEVPKEGEYAQYTIDFIFI